MRKNCVMMWLEQYNDYGIQINATIFEDKETYWEFPWSIKNTLNDICPKPLNTSHTFRFMINLSQSRYRQKVGWLFLELELFDFTTWMRHCLAPQRSLLYVTVLNWCEMGYGKCSAAGLGWKGVKMCAEVKVKQTHYWPGQVQRAPGGWVSRFQENRHMKVVRLSALRTGHLYPLRKYSWHSFLLEA
jgi:hypothetical protein